ncbi:hypothetical protein DL766_006126 [Monosporascus sp. MC13-8B]|nr:hypothetical protein DL763_004831 [Monosporascus cannonballus]RYP27997.1 hypothetical protein DL766_006126 [Monosporascus sp. MC13-8B]
MIDDTLEDTSSPGGEEHKDMPKTAGEDPSGIPGDNSRANLHIEFVVRRNLEHILSVCSTPLKYERLVEGHSSAAEPTSDICPVAVTCGDVSCHRVCTSASFFAVWFLSVAARRLTKLKQREPDNLYVEYLLKRISVVCRGHFEWVSQKADRKADCFVANYWVTGNAMSTSGFSRQPEDSVTDTAFQLLKTRECIGFSHEGEACIPATDSIKKACESWVDTLEKLDRLTGRFGEVVSAVSLQDKAVSLNGFCPGQVNEITQEPVLFDREEDRDYYFHASFEIPFVLLTNAVRINDKYREQTNPSEVKEPYSPKRQSAAPQSDVRDYPQGRKVPPKRQQVSGEEQVRQTESMKKAVPFSRLFDSTAIAEIDEEWLCNYPLSLSNETGMADSEISKMLEDLIQQEGGSDVSGHVIMTAAKLRREKGVLDSDDNEWRSWVVDIPKTRRSRKWGRGDGIYPIYHTNAKLQEELTKPRTAENAKKRLIWLPKANVETALVCYLAIVDAEKPAISLFMNRHWNQEDYFFDDTTMMTNTWETELHLSFYHLAEHLGSGDIRPLSEDIFPHKETQIAKASMGFRFFGDFFDRYWTYPPFQYSDKEKGWRQRKVLELYLFEHILATVVKCSREILDEIKSELGVREGAFSSAILTSEDYFFSSVQWQRLQNALAVIEEKIEGVRMEVSKWETRERDRGKEKPRWTRNDERKYGGIIKKLVRLTNKQITNLHGVHAGIKSLKETLMRSQEQIRADLSLPGSEDIRFFTYVTVVFLPLGFAASIFGMSGNPGADLIVSLVICAIIALVITVFALLNAKTLGHIISRGFHLIDRYSRAKMKHSILMQKREDRNKEIHDEEAKGSHISRPAGKDGFSKDHGQRLHGRYEPITPRTEYTWRFGFLVAYILLEFPARRVAAAYDVLKTPSLTWIGFVDVALGVVSIPFFVVFGPIQICVFNAIDLLRLLFALVGWLVPAPPSLDQDSFKDSMRWLALPFDNLRPLRNIKLLVDKKRADWRRTQEGKDEGKRSKSPTGKRKDEDA